MTKDYDYNKLFARLNSGERDIDIARDIGISVGTLYQRFNTAGLIKSVKQTKAEDWAEQYEAFNNGKTVQQIAKDLNVGTNTVRNNFYKLGYVPKTKTAVNEEQFYHDKETGLSNHELAQKYNITITYVRTLLRNK